MKDFARIHSAIMTVTLACAVACGGTTAGGATTSGATRSDSGTGGTGGQGGASSIPPAQAAVAITISPGAGACRVAGGEITTPPDTPGNVGQVGASLSCDLQSAGCTPDAHVVVQGDPNTTVTCSVAPNGGSFDVSASVISGARMSFSATGTVTPNGGTLAVYEFDQSTQSTLQDPKCSIAISNNFGTVKKGAIWARFDCANFTDPNAVGGTSCVAAGSFLFENCGG